MQGGEVWFRRRMGGWVGRATEGTCRPPCWPGCPVGLVQSRAWRTAFVSLSGYRTVLMGIDGIDPIVSAKDSSLGIPDGHLLSPFAHSAIPTAGAARKSRFSVHQMESPFSAIHPGNGTGHQNITNHKPAVQVCFPAFVGLAASRKELVPCLAVLLNNFESCQPQLRA